MKNDDLEYMVEQYGIETYRAAKILKGKPIVHHEEDSDADPERIVCKATLGERNLIGGLGGFAVNLKVTYYSNRSDKAFNNIVRKGLVEAMFESTSTRTAVPCAALFSRLDLGDEVTTDRSLNDNSREYSVTFHFLIAKLAITPVASGVT